jgi:hypothetical protein
VQRRDVARLIATYTQPGGLVGDLADEPGGHTTIADAAGYLGRRHVVLHAATEHRQQSGPWASLILAGQPCAEADGVDLHDTTHALHRWRTLLRPGGYLLVALATPVPRDGRVSPRATVIAAARTAGLSWQQELLVPLAPLAEFEPRAMPDTAAATRPALIGGRHQPAHVKLLAFQHRGGTDA